VAINGGLTANLPNAGDAENIGLVTNPTSGVTNAYVFGVTAGGGFATYVDGPVKAGFVMKDGCCPKSPGGHTAAAAAPLMVTTTQLQELEELSVNEAVCDVVAETTWCSPPPSFGKLPTPSPLFPVVKVPCPELHGELTVVKNVEAKAKPMHASLADDKAPLTAVAVVPLPF